jgi:hypothetical protein
MSHHFPRTSQVIARAVPVVLCVCLGSFAAVPVRAQGRLPVAKPEPGASTASGEETSEIAAGWALLAQGQSQQAAARAARVLARLPHSGAALILAIEADIAHSGSRAALDRYEHWLGPRALEEPAVVRRVARAVLLEALKGTERMAKAEAWRGLADDGENLQAPFGPIRASDGGSTPEARAMAAVGDDAAVRALAANVPGDLANRVRTLEALGASGSSVAVASIVPLLEDSRFQVRVAAVDALGRIGGPDAVSALKPMLSDHLISVKGKTAGALYRLGDSSGLQLLNEMAADDMAQVRLLAAEGLAASPDGAWTALVTSLTRNESPEIRARAAVLIAPHDPGLARDVLGALSEDSNPAVRELASGLYADVVGSLDLTALRRLLREPVALTRVRAAVRVLAVVR